MIVTETTTRTPSRRRGGAALKRLVRTRELRDRRYAERVLVAGRLVHPGAQLEHGSASTYVNWGCRCLPCTSARSADQRARYVRRMRRRNAGVLNVEACAAERPTRAASTTRDRSTDQRRREWRRAQRVVINGRLVSTADVEHGSESTYTNWYCRCVPCTRASRDRRRNYRRQRAVNELLTARAIVSSRSAG